MKAGPADNNLMPEYNNLQSKQQRFVYCDGNIACDFTV